MSLGDPGETVDGFQHLPHQHLGLLMHADQVLMLLGKIVMHPGEKLNGMAECFMPLGKPVQSLVDAIPPVVHEGAQTRL